jgi:uncharacterized protein (TIGR02145 family)
MGIASTFATTSYTIPSSHIQGICPTGWHLPKATEWDVLAITLGGSDVAGIKMKLNNTQYLDWNRNFNDGNSSGFGAIVPGARHYYGGFFNRGSLARFLEAEQYDAIRAYDRGLNSGYTQLSRYSSHKTYAFSVRCLMD